MTNLTDRSRRRRGAPFWETVDQSGECWLWLAALDAAGYGKFWHPERKELMPAHRYSYEITNGAPVDSGVELHHTCRTRACVRPDHLVPMIRAEHLRAHGDLVTHCPQGHAYTPENTRLMTYGNGRRACKRCHADREARARKEGRRG